MPLEFVVELMVEVHSAYCSQDEILRAAPEEFGFETEEALLFKFAIVLGQVPVDGYE